MEGKNTEIINSVYNSYGPMIGKICENTNNFMKENFLENPIPSFIEETKISMQSISNIQSVPNVQSIPSIPSVPTVQFNPVPQIHQVNPLPKTQSLSKTIESSATNILNSKSINNISNNTSVSTGLDPVLDIKNNLESNFSELKSEVIEEATGGSVTVPVTGSFLSKKIKIFGYNISIWMLILIVILVACIVYFIYKYLWSPKKLLNYTKL